MSRDNAGEFPNIHPLIAFETGIVEGLVMLELEWATSRAEYDSGFGRTVEVALTGPAAVALGRALIERGEAATAAKHV